MQPGNSSIRGIIRFLNLQKFWLSLTKEQQAALIRYYRSGLGAIPNGSPIEGEIWCTDARPLQYLWGLISWAVADHDYDLADKIIDYGWKVYDTATYTDRHFFLQQAAECYYKQRDIRPDALEKVEYFCKTDIKVFPVYSRELIREFKTLPRIETVIRLAILLEKQQRYEEAIEVCNYAIRNHLRDGTKGGFEGRVEKMKKKIK